VNTDSAKRAIEFTRIVGRDKEGRPSYLEVPGHDSKRYFVKLRRNGVGLLSHCYLDRSGYGNADCPSRQVCYHTLAAIMKAAREVNMRVIWCSSEANARRLLNLGGQVFYVTNNHGKKAWGIVKEEGK
jgi:hypothetical protein